MLRKSFRRSLSFPIPTASSSTPKIKGRGAATLPCRFSPFVANLHDQIRDLLTWHSQPKPRSRSWIVDGLSRLDRLHAAVEDLLQHPQARDPLRRRLARTDRLLEDFLRLADAYGSIRCSIADLKDRVSATHAAARRGDEGRIATCARSQRRAGKDVIRIAEAAARNVGRWGPVGEDDVSGAVRDAAAVTAEATEAAVAAVVDMSAAVAAAVAGGSSLGLGLRFCRSCVVGPASKKETKWSGEALEEVEECIGEVERGCERLFRNLVNARVLLLNVLTPSL